MTDNFKKFGELLSTDESAKKELEAAISSLGRDARKSFNDAAIKLAAKHGITLTDEDFKQEIRELSEDELGAVAGGSFCGGSWFDGACDDPNFCW